MTSNRRQASRLCRTQRLAVTAEMLELELEERGQLSVSGRAMNDGRPVVGGEGVKEGHRLDGALRVGDAQDALGDDVRSRRRMG